MAIKSDMYVGFASALIFSGMMTFWYMYFQPTSSRVSSLRSVSNKGITLRTAARIRNSTIQQVTWIEKPTTPDFRLENKCTPKDLFKLGKPGFFENLPNEFLPGYKGPCFMIKKGDREVLRCLPHFYVIGVTKCGTTEMWAKLRLHPQVSVSGVVKESDWWSCKRTRSVPFSTYLDSRSANMVERFQQNDSLRNWLVTADGSPTTIYEFDNWRRFYGNNYDGPKCTAADVLFAAHPTAKLIVTIRDPVSRLYSHYCHFNNIEGSPQQFHEMVLAKIEIYKTCRTKLSARACSYTGFAVRQKTL
nr:carbohydrate sulfotransferase 15-like [Lytechinus pictus]